MKELNIPIAFQNSLKGIFLFRALNPIIENIKLNIPLFHEKLNNYGFNNYSLKNYSPVCYNNASDLRSEFKNDINATDLDILFFFCGLLFLQKLNNESSQTEIINTFCDNLDQFMKIKMEGENHINRMS